MRYTKCRNCGVSLVIDENDYMPGCREMEEVMCPMCNKIADRVFTSGIPRASVISKEEYKNIEDQFE